jgi:adiponectin receptor
MSSSKDNIYLESYKIFSRFDYAGINVLIAGSTFPGLYYGMYCKMNLALFYIGLIATIAIGLFILSVFEWMHTNKYRTFKSLCYGGFGVFTGIPLIHMTINEIFFN